MSFHSINRGTAPLSFLALIAVLFLSGCARWGGLAANSPDQAVLNAILNEDQGANLTIDKATVRIRHTQALDVRVFYLVSFSGRMDAQAVECVYLYETLSQPRAGGWVVSSGGGGCSSPGGGGQHGGGQSSSSDERGQRAHSEVYGQITSPDIVTIQVDWEDGQVQEAQAVNGVYLVVRDGLHNHGDIRFLNAAGETVETLTSEIAPGKK